jgi:hypothetical protein
MDLTAFYDIIEKSITELGVNPVDCRGENPGQWNLKKGDTTVWVDLWYIEKEDRPYFQTMAPIFAVPSDPETKNKVLEELLTINDSLFGVAFSIFNDFIYLKVVREASGMDNNEAIAMILRIGNYAELHRKELSEKYGMTLS